jgi:hypothetical protein
VIEDEGRCDTRLPHWRTVNPTCRRIMSSYRDTVALMLVDLLNAPAPPKSSGVFPFTEDGLSTDRREDKIRPGEACSICSKSISDFSLDSPLVCLAFRRPEDGDGVSEGQIILVLLESSALVFKYLDRGTYKNTRER